jgi:hypothetical protein
MASYRVLLYVTPNNALHLRLWLPFSLDIMKNPESKAMITIASLVFILSCGAYGYDHYTKRHHRHCNDQAVRFMQEYVRSGQFEKHREQVKKEQNFEDATIPGFDEEDVERMLEKIGNLYTGDLLFTHVQKTVYEKCMNQIRLE